MFDISLASTTSTHKNKIKKKLNLDRYDGHTRKQSTTLDVTNSIQITHTNSEQLKRQTIVFVCSTNMYVTNIRLKNNTRRDSRNMYVTSTKLHKNTIRENIENVYVEPDL